MQLVNIPTGRRPCVAHFPGPSRDKPFQKWLFEEIAAWDIKPDLPPHFELVCFASADRVADAPLIRQCSARGIPLTILGSNMTKEDFQKRLHFNKLYLLRDHIDSGKAATFIVALDACDVLLSGSLAALVSRYHRHYDGKIVFGAECNFMYKMAQWNNYSIGKDAPYTEAEEIKRASEYACRTFAEWKFLNGGMMVAQREALRAALNDAIAIADRVPPGVYPCDQSVWMWLWHNSPHPIDLDFECELFQNLNHAEPFCFCIDDEEHAPLPRTSRDVVYLFTGFDASELALSVKSVRKNMSGVNRIYVIGGDAATVAAAVPGVEHIPFGDPNVKNREANMTRKVLLACHLRRISDPFILMSDDQFVMKPCDASAMPLRFKGSLEHGRIETTYGQRTRETYLECLRLLLPTLNYNTHFPVPIQKQAYVDALARVPWDTESGDGILCRSIYGNSIGGGEVCIDAKDSARAAIAALDVAFFSLPNAGQALLGHIQASLEAGA